MKCRKDFVPDYENQSSLFFSGLPWIKHYVPLIRLGWTLEKMEEARSTYVQEGHKLGRLLEFRHNFFMQVKLSQAQGEAWSLVH